MPYAKDVTRSRLVFMNQILEDNISEADGMKLLGFTAGASYRRYFRLQCDVLTYPDHLQKIQCRWCTKKFPDLFTCHYHESGHKEARPSSCAECGVALDERNYKRTRINKLRCLGCQRSRYKRYDTRTKQQRVKEASDARRRTRIRVLQAYGGHCVCCGETQVEFLTFDHVDGGGNAHKRREKINRLFTWLWKNDCPEGYQILCYNCNAAKSVYGQCPHQLKAQV
jgi:hypothetical protein